MIEDSPSDHENNKISRRRFMQFGGAALAGSAALGSDAELVDASEAPGMFPTSDPKSAQVQAYRTLGRTGWQVSDVGMGSVPLRESAVVRYAYDKGVNYFDTAEGYGRGAAETAIGDAMQHMDRSKIFIATKGRVGAEDTADQVIERVRKSLERLKTDYVDAYSIHAVSSIEALGQHGYHAAMDQLKAEGRVRFTGCTYHGPRDPSGPSMADVLSAAAEDGRFDVLLLVYNFMNHDEADRIIATAKANNVGTTAMKTSPGVLSFDPVDPANLTEQQERYVQRFVDRGQSREQALGRLESQAARQKDLYDKTRPFVDQYGIQTQEQLRLGSIHWVLQNPDMHTACIAFTNFDLVDKVIPLSGTKLGSAELQLLQECRYALGDQYCRHGCTECSGSCPNDVPVSTVMRYAYYYEGQGREKASMKLYADLNGMDASACRDCVGHCTGACPYGIDIQPRLFQVHDLLTLA